MDDLPSKYSAKKRSKNLSIPNEKHLKHEPHHVLIMNLNPSSSFHPLPIHPPHHTPHLISQTQRSTHTHNHPLTLLPPCRSFSLEIQRGSSVQHSRQDRVEFGSAGVESEVRWEGGERTGKEDGRVEAGAGVVYVDVDVGVGPGGEDVCEEWEERTEEGW